MLTTDLKSEGQVDGSYDRIVEREISINVMCTNTIVCVWKTMQMRNWEGRLRIWIDEDIKNEVISHHGF